MRLATKGTETEDLFETLANKSPVGLYIVQDGKFCYTNPPFQSTTGYTEDELLGRDSLELVVPEDRERVRENAIKMLKGELTLPYQFRVTHKNDSIRWIMESVVSIQYRGRRATLGDFIDITERKQIEEALQAEKNKLQSLIDAMEYHLSIQDTEYNIIYQNEPSRIVSGGDHLGEKCYRVYEGQKRVCDGCPVEEAFKDGKSHTTERRMVIPSGEVILLESTANPIRDGRGRVVSCLEIVRDITERKQAEEARREAEEEKSALLEEAPIGIMHVDLKGKITYVNKRFESESGYSREEIVGKNGFQLDWLPAGTMRHLTKRIAARLRGRPSKTWETQFKCKDGRWIWVELEGKVLRKSGVPVGFQIIARNMTARKQMEEALQAERNKLQSLIDAMEDGLNIIDTDYNLIYQNEPGRISTGGDHLGEKCYRAYEGRETVCDGCPVEKAFKDGKSHTAERRTTIAGKVAFWENTANPIRDAEGRIVACLEIARNITGRKQAEEALKAEKNKLQSLIDAMEYTLTIQDTEYNIIYQNEPSRIASGGDHVGEKCYRAYEGQESICEDCPVEKAFKDGKSHTTERRTAISGKVAFWENTANPIRDAAGRVVSCLELARDVTERKKQEQALADELTRRRIFIDQSLDGIVVLDVDARVVEANQRFADMLGYTLEEVRELHTWDWDKNFPPERILEMGRNADEKGFRLETKHTRKDGSVIDVDISINGAMCAGQKLIFCICRDVTERKQVEEKVQHLNLVLRAIRNINQLIARGTDRDSLLKGACDTFVKTRGYYSAWIALLDGSGKLVTAAEAGLGKSFLQVTERLKRGELTHCGCKVLEKSGVLVIKDVPSECEDCPVAKKEDTGRGAMSIRLEYGGKMYGLMTVSIPSGRAAEEEEQDLFEEIAVDIAFALYNIEQGQERNKMEEQLSKTQAQLSSAVQMAHLGPWEYDATNDLFIFNDAFYEMFHTTAEEVGGYTMSSAEYARRFVHPEDAHLVGEEVRKALQADDPNFSRQLDHRIIYGDGKVGYISVRFFIVKDETRSTVRTYGVNQDITERKQAEEALQAEKNKLQSVIDAMADALTIHDRDYNIIFQSDPSRKSSGGDRTGEKCYRVYEGREGICEDCPVEKAFKDGKPHTSERQRVISGEITFWENTANPIRDAKGEVVSCLEIGRNITERKKQEQALANEATRRRLLVDQSLDGIVVLDVDAKVVEANQRFAEMLGYTLEEVRELHTWDWDKKFPPGKILEMGRNVDEKGFHLETQHTRKDGSVIDVDISINASMFGGQKLIFCVGRDVTERKQQEQALKDSEESYRELADSITEVFFAMDKHLRYTYWNKASEILTGIRAEDALGKSLPEIFPNTSGARRAKKVYRDVLRTQQSQTFVNDFDINGRHYAFEISAYPSRGGISVFARDITERKRAEEALQQSEEKYRALFESTVIGTIVIDAETMKVVMANKAAAEMFGLSSAEEGIGANPLDFAPPEGREGVLELIVKELFEQDLKQIRELQMITKDGRKIWVSATAAKIMHEGRLAGLVSLTDITVRKEMEEAIKQAAEEWRKTFDSISDAISIHDRDFRILRANKAFADIFHMKPSQIIGKHCYELHKGEKPKSGCPQKQTLATEKPAAAEFYESHLGKFLLESTSPIFNEKGEVVGTIHVTRDITEQKQQNERLIMAARLASVGELAAGTAHELNNPLTSVIGFSQLLIEKDIPDDVREDLKLIYKEAQRAANVTKNLLTFARKQAPVKQLTQINNIIEDVLKLRAYEHKVNSIEVKKRLAPDLPEIMVDYSQMQQVFLNIIINAEYFMTEAHKRGTLTITTKKQNSTVRISFADDGPGIPQENLSRIFDPFFTTKEAGKGTGLGLSICHGIVTEHGGQIYARSQPGKGATFFVELPIKSS